MNEQEGPSVESRALSAFESWTKSLATDAKAISSVLTDGQAVPAAQRVLAGGLNYLFKSLDLIDDGIEGLGYLDDALVLRLCADKARRVGGPLPDAVAELGAGSELIREVLGDLAVRLERFVGELEGMSVRGRTAESVVADADAREELALEVASWAARYEPPAFVQDEKTLVKLQAFLNAKLPR